MMYGQRPLPTKKLVFFRHPYPTLFSIQHISYNTVFMYMSSTCSGNNVQLSQHHKWGFEAKGLK